MSGGRCLTACASVMEPPSICLFVSEGMSWSWLLCPGATIQTNWTSCVQFRLLEKGDGQVTPLHYNSQWGAWFLHVGSAHPPLTLHAMTLTWPAVAQQHPTHPPPWLRSRCRRSLRDVILVEAREGVGMRNGFPRAVFNGEVVVLQFNKPSGDSVVVSLVPRHPFERSMISY